MQKNPHFEFLNNLMRSNPMSKCMRLSVGFILDEDKYPYKWTLNLLQDNGIMVDIWFLMESKVIHLWVSNRLLNHVIPLNIWLIQIKNILAQHWSTTLLNFPKCELSFSFTNNFPQLGPFPWKTKVPNFPELPKLTHSTLSFYSRYSFSLSTSLDPTKLCSLDTFSFHISGS
jgi:hypothetical protein